MARGEIHVVVLRETGEVRSVEDGEWFVWPEGDVGCWGTKQGSGHPYPILEELLNGPPSTFPTLTEVAGDNGHK